MLFHLSVASFDDPTELNTKLDRLLHAGAAALEGVILAELSTIMGEDLQHKKDPFLKCVLRARASYQRRTGTQ